MSKYELRKLLDLIMCCDPWPCDDHDNQEAITTFADEESRRHEFGGWLDAYHMLLP